MFKIFFLINFTVLNILGSDNYPSLQWVKSFEYNLSCVQVYKTAQRQFDSLDLKNIESVMLEHKEGEKLPLAIVTDIDETILLNYKFEEEIIKGKVPFSNPLFKKYVNLGQQIPIKAAIKYFQYLSSKGIKIIYISNRTASMENATYEYLKKYGYPIDSKDDLLLKGEKEEWSRDKSSRRSYISKKYTVIQIFGDNLKDFTQTENEIIKHKNRFGISWFLLPNPIYGSWLKTN